MIKNGQGTFFSRYWKILPNSDFDLRATLQREETSKRDHSFDQSGLAKQRGQKKYSRSCDRCFSFFFSLEISQSFCLTIRFLGVLHSHRDNEMSLQALQVVGPLEGGHNVVENM